MARSSVRENTSRRRSEVRKAVDHRLGKAGGLYGTAFAEGPHGWGTMFEIKK